MEATIKQSSTPSEFLAEVGKDLKAIKDVDYELATIVAEHMLVVTASDKAVANAKDAIVALAKARASKTGVDLG